MKLFYKIIKDQNGVYALTTVLLLPATLLFMGLAMGTLTLMNDKSRLADASEAAALAVAKADQKGGSDSVTTALDVYKYYFPNDITNLEEDGTVVVGYKSIKDPTVKDNPTLTTKYYCSEWGQKKPDGSHDCLKETPYTSESVLHSWHFYRTSIHKGSFHSFAAGLFGTLGFDALEKVSNTGVAVVKATDTTEYTKPVVPFPKPIKPIPPNLTSFTISIVIDESQSMSSGTKFDDVKKLVENILTNLRKKAGVLTDNNKNAKMEVQFMYVTSDFLNTDGVCLSGSSFGTPPNELSTAEVSTATNLQNTLMFQPPKYAVECPLKGSTSKFFNIANTKEYNALKSSLKSVKAPAALTSLAGPLIYSFQELYNKRAPTDPKNTLTNMSIIITDGIPNVDNPADVDKNGDHIPSPHGPADPTTGTKDRATPVELLDLHNFCVIENSLMKAKFHSSMKTLLILLKGISGATAVDGVNTNIMPNCYPKNSNNQYYNPNFKWPNVLNESDKITDKIVSLLTSGTTAFYSGSNTSSENQNNGYDYGNNSVTPSKPKGPIDSKTDGSPVLTYRGGKDTPPVP